MPFRASSRALGDACLVHARITGDHVLLTCRVPSDKKGTQSSIYSTHSGTLHACQCLWRHVTSSGTPLLPEERHARDWTGHWLAFHAPRHRPASRPVRRLSRSGRIPAGNLARIDPAVTGSWSGGAVQVRGHPPTPELRLSVQRAPALRQLAGSVRRRRRRRPAATAVRSLLRMFWHVFLL